MQEDLTNRIAAQVDGQVGREGLRRLRRRPPANLDAYDLYLQRRELHGRATEADTLMARQMFERAIVADPGYAPAHAYQAYTVQRGSPSDGASHAAEPRWMSRSGSRTAPWRSNRNPRSA